MQEAGPGGRDLKTRLLETMVQGSSRGEATGRGVHGTQEITDPTAPNWGGAPAAAEPTHPGLCPRSKRDPANISPQHSGFSPAQGRASFILAEKEFWFEQDLIHVHTHHYPLTLSCHLGLLTLCGTDAAARYRKVKGGKAGPGDRVQDQKLIDLLRTPLMADQGTGQ